MKNKSRIVAVLLMTATLGLAGCGNNNSSNNNSASTTTAATSLATEGATKADTADDFDMAAYIANYTPKTTLSNNGLFDYEVKINDAVLSCPISAAELDALGYKPMKNFTATIKPNEICTIGNTDAHYYTNNDGLAVIVDNLVTTSEKEIEYDNEKPRDDVYYTLIEINSKEKSNWSHTFQATFYGGTIGTSTESEIVDKCGKFDKSKNLSRTYYEHPEAENKEKNSIHLYIDDNTLTSIGFECTPDKIKK